MLIENREGLERLVRKVIETSRLEGGDAVAIIDDSLLPLQISYHEVGHALVGIRLGAVLDYVTLYPDPITSFRSYKDSHSQGVISHAGCLAHHLATDSQEKPSWCEYSIVTWHGTLEGDFGHCLDAWYDVARERGIEAGKNISCEWARERKGQAWELLTAERAKLHKLAILLLERRKLSGDEVQAILG